MGHPVQREIAYSVDLLQSQVPRTNRYPVYIYDHIICDFGRILYKRFGSGGNLSLPPPVYGFLAWVGQQGSCTMIQRSTGAWFCQSSGIIIRQELLQEQEQKNSQDSVVTRSTGASAWTGAPVWTEAYKISLATFHGQNTRILAKYKSKTGYFRLILFQDLFYKVLQRQKLLFKQELLLEQELLNLAEASASDSAEASDPAEVWKSRSGRSLYFPKSIWSLVIPYTKVKRFHGWGCTVTPLHERKNPLLLIFIIDQISLFKATHDAF